MFLYYPLPEMRRQTMGRGWGGCEFSDLAQSDQNSALQLGGPEPQSPHLGNGMAAPEGSLRAGELVDHAR